MWMKYATAEISSYALGVCVDEEWIYGISLMARITNCIDFG